MTTTETTRCDECRRELEACACCHRIDCPDPICHRDLIFLVRESIPTAHGHGG